jgi:GGDEF domain-containing protein
MTVLFQSELAGSARGPSFAELSNRMELEFELARARSAPAAVLRCFVERLERLTPERREPILAALGRRLAVHATRPGTIAALRAAELFVYLPDTSVEEAERIANAWIADARKLALDGVPAPVTVGLCAGVAATRERADLYFDTLLEVAGEGMLVAQANGGTACVHSELYDLHQRRAERHKGPRKPPPPAPVPAAETPARDGTAAPATHGSAPATPQSAAVNAMQAGHAVHVPRAAGPVVDQVAARVQQILPDAVAVPGVDLAALEARVLDLARAAFERALAEQEARMRGEIEVYQRRIAKMQQALQESENEKLVLARSSGVDTGMASVYRDVQGLTGDEADFARRSGLLKAIAEANLELHAVLNRKSA